MEKFYFQCDDKAWFRVRIRIRTETYAEPVFIKTICSKKLILKLIRFQGYSQTSFLVSSAVYLTFLRIDLSTITREDTLGWGGGDVENVNYETRIET
jgi:hypothetical protein